MFRLASIAWFYTVVFCVISLILLYTHARTHTHIQFSVHARSCKRKHVGTHTHTRASVCNWISAKALVHVNPISDCNAFTRIPPLTHGHANVHAWWRTHMRTNTHTYTHVHKTSSLKPGSILLQPYPAVTNEHSSCWGFPPTPLSSSLAIISYFCLKPLRGPAAKYGQACVVNFEQPSKPVQRS